MVFAPSTPPSLLSGIFNPIEARTLVGGAPTRMVASANQGPPIPFNVEIDTTNNSFNSRRECYAPSNADITDIVLAFSGIAFSSGAAEQNFPVSFTVVQATIEYPIGTTLTTVYSAGSTSLAVTPGRTMVWYDPCPIFIPRGSQWAIKLLVNWTAPGPFWYSAYAGATIPTQEWVAAGTNVANNTTNFTVLTNSFPLNGFTALPYATLSSQIPVIGGIGDSIMVGATDYSDPVTQCTGLFRALQRQVPFINLGCGGSTNIEYLSRTEGRNLLLRNPLTNAPAITHLDFEYGINDADGGATLATLQNNLLAAIDPFIARGVKVLVRTVTPYTTSTNGWLGYNNGTQSFNASGPSNVVLSYNAWLRTNWQSLGIYKLIDVALAVDPLLIGQWNSDVGATISPTGAIAGIYATVSSGVITAAAYSPNQSTGSIGSGYPASTTLNWSAQPYPAGTGGSGGTGTVTTNSSGFMNQTGTVTTGGSGYGTTAPMLNILGPYTVGGLHPGVRGINQIIYATGYGPNLFGF